MNNLSFVFFGSTDYSKKLLIFLIKKNIIPKAIFSSPQEYTISHSKEKVKNFNYANLKEISDQYNLPFYEIDSVDGKRVKDFNNKLKDLSLDLILVLGWYYLIPKSVRDKSKYGAWGIHASLLPNYAGGAPLNWAMINGEKKTGVTLFRLSDGVDDGDIISQKSFLIDTQDTIKDVYEKATKSSCQILYEAINNIENINYIKQDKTKIKYFPQRKPEDGEIDLSKSAEEIYNFVRAQSSPYPGAFIKTIDGKKIIIEKVRIE